MSSESLPPPPASSEVFVYPENTRSMVWIKQGKTDHAAFILKEHNGRMFVQWAVSQLTQWVEPGVEIKTELPSRRRKGRRDDLDPGFVFSSTANNNNNNNNTNKKSKTEAPTRTVKTTTTTTTAKASNKKSSPGNKKRAKSPGKGTTNTSVANKKRKQSSKEFKYPIGTKVYKEFPPFGWFIGKVDEMTDDNLYHIVYEDEDEETLEEAEVGRYLLGNDSSLEIMGNEAVPLQEEEGTIQQQAAGENTASETQPLRRRSPRSESKVAVKRAPTDNKNANRNNHSSIPENDLESSVVPQPQKPNPTAAYLPQKSTTMKGSKRLSSNSKHPSTRSSSHIDDETHIDTTVEKASGGILSNRPSSPLLVEEDTETTQRLDETNDTATSNTGGSHVASTQTAVTNETRQLPCTTSRNAEAIAAEQGAVGRASYSTSISKSNPQSSSSNEESRAVKPAIFSTDEPQSTYGNIGEPITLLLSSNGKRGKPKKQTPLLPRDNNQMTTEAFLVGEKEYLKQSTSKHSNAETKSSSDKAEATGAPSSSNERAFLKQSVSKHSNIKTNKKTSEASADKAKTSKGYLLTSDKLVTATRAAPVKETTTSTINDQQAKTTKLLDATRHASGQKTNAENASSRTSNDQQSKATGLVKAARSASAKKTNTQKVAPKPPRASIEQQANGIAHSGTEPPRKATSAATWPKTRKFPKAFFNNVMALKSVSDTPRTTKVVSTDGSGKQPPSRKKSEVTGNSVAPPVHSGKMSENENAVAAKQTTVSIRPSATFEKVDSEAITESPPSADKSGAALPPVSLERSSKPKIGNHFQSEVDGEKSEREQTSTADSRASAGSKTYNTPPSSNVLDKQSNAENSPAPPNDEELLPNSHEAGEEKDGSENKVEASDAAEPDEEEIRAGAEARAKSLLTTASSLPVSEMINAHLSPQETLAATELETETKAAPSSDTFSVAVLGTVRTSISTDAASANLGGANDSENLGVEAMGKAYHSIQSDYSKPQLEALGVADHGEGGGNEKVRDSPTTVSFKGNYDAKTAARVGSPGRTKSKRLVEEPDSSKESAICADVHSKVLTKSGSASANTSPEVASSNKSQFIEESSSSGGKKPLVEKQELLGLAEALAGLPSSMPADTNVCENQLQVENTKNSHISNKASGSEAASTEDEGEAENAGSEASTPKGKTMPNYGLSEGTRCPVCSNHIEALAHAPVDWSRPLQYPQNSFAIEVIAKHTEECHKEEPIWNIMEAQLGMEEHKQSAEEHMRATGNPQSPPKNLLSPENFCRIALRHAIGCSFAVDESLQDMAKLRDMFIRRLGIARGFIQWSSDYFLYGRTCTNCTGDVVPGYEMRRSALLLMAYLEDHIMEHAFEKNSHITEGFALTLPVAKWRNMVQNVFLDPRGIENAWFVEGHDRPYRAQGY